MTRSRLIADNIRLTTAGSRLIAHGVPLTMARPRVIADDIRLTTAESRLTAHGVWLSAEGATDY